MDAIIFDFGNVVGFFDHGLTLARLAPHTEMPAREIFAKIYQGELEELFESGRISEDDFLRQFRAQCGLRCSDGFLAAAIADIFRPNPEVCTLIPQLKNRYRLLLGSNTNVIHSKHFRRQFAEVLRHFDALILSHEIGDRKPRPGFFRHCLEMAGCEPNRCLFIDDIEANVEGALACGLAGLVYAPGGTLSSQLAALGVEAA